VAKGKRAKIPEIGGLTNARGCRPSSELARDAHHPNGTGPKA